MSRKLWMVLGALAVVAIAAATAWSLRDEYADARIATAYAAKQTCSCVHISGRALDACLADLPAGEAARAQVREAGAHVRASLLFGAASAEAAYEDGYGCRLVD